MRKPYDEEAQIEVDVRYGMFNLWLVRYEQTGSAIADFSGVVFSSTENEGDSTEARPLRLDNAAVQSLMDSLWRAGVRPQSIGTAGHLAATEKHLEDMRKIVFGSLQKQGAI